MKIDDHDTLYHPDLAKREADIKAQIDKLQEELHHIFILKLLRKVNP